ncbi:hypothetical protein Ato02nite_086820 [Paractinoplanes toevensis]|uniref:Uncharacterized protein n=1 Tax=Paractinoplanes toevensis TaxID=571911 RepID=A0A919WAZ2_9ACTN|nr:hypothetical protein Ato02nite_086820 [Actinoplanes toevensis]
MWQQFYKICEGWRPSDGSDALPSPQRGRRKIAQPPAPAPARVPARVPARAPAPAPASARAPAGRPGPERFTVAGTGRT